MDTPNRLTPADLRIQENLRLSAQKPSQTPETKQLAQVGFSYAQTSPKTKKRRSHRSTKRIRLTDPIPFSLILIIFIVIAMISFTASPLATLVRLATDSFNTQDVTLDKRLSQMLNYKLNHSPDEPVKYQILADYRTITPNLKTSLRKEKIILDQKTHTATYADKIIFGDQFLANLSSDLGLIKATNDATAIRRLVYEDKIWQKYRQESKVTQTGLDAKNTNRTIKEQELILTKANTNGFRFNTSGEHSTIEQFNSITNNLTALNQTADQLEKSKQTPNGQSFVNLIFVDKPNETCSLYQTVRATQNYQKTAQAEQLSKLAALLMSEADKLKAGEADSEVINYLNDRLTYSGTFIDGNGNLVNQKSAMDSYAQRYLNGNINQPLDGSAQKYVLGANEPLAKTLKSLEDSSENTNCQTGGLWYDFKNFFTNIWNFLTGSQPSDTSTQYLTNEVKLNTTSTNLSAMTGLATAPDFSGEDLANGFVSGVAQLMNNNAKNGGMSVLTKNQAVAYLTEQQNLLARRAEIDRQTLSPFDTRSPHTFLGSIVAQLNFAGHQSNPVSRLSSFSLIAKNNLLGINQSAMASSQQISQSLDLCYDQEYRQANPNIALGPFCNPIYGAPIEVLETNPEEVIAKLVSSGNLEVVDGSCDANGNFCKLKTANQLLDYETNCINRTTSLGNTDNNNNSGVNCLVEDDISKLFPIYFADLRINGNLRQSELAELFSTNNWPVPNYTSISSPFGYRTKPKPGMHHGIDIVAPTGATVVASINGSVTFAGEDSSGMGGLGIKIKTDDGKTEIIYWHLSKITVQLGQRVEIGYKIGEVGSTGYSTGPHLHFEYHLNGQPVDPMLYLTPFSPALFASESIIGAIILNMDGFTIPRGKEQFRNAISKIVSNGARQNACPDCIEIGADTKNGSRCLQFAYHQSAVLIGGTDEISRQNGALSYTGSTGFQEPKKIHSTTAGPNDPTKRQMLNYLYEQLSRGKVCIIKVGKTGNSYSDTRPGTPLHGQHFVTAIGFKSNITSANQLQETDLLTLDSWDGKLKPLGHPNSRHLYSQRGEWWAQCTK